MLCCVLDPGSDLGLHVDGMSCPESPLACVFRKSQIRKSAPGFFRGDSKQNKCLQPGLRSRKCRRRGLKNLTTRYRNSNVGRTSILGAPALSWSELACVHDRVSC